METPIQIYLFGTAIVTLFVMLNWEPGKAGKQSRILFTLSALIGYSFLAYGFYGVLHSRRHHIYMECLETMHDSRGFCNYYARITDATLSDRKEHP